MHKAIKHRKQSETMNIYDLASVLLRFDGSISSLWGTLLKWQRRFLKQELLSTCRFGGITPVNLHLYNPPDLSALLVAMEEQKPEPLDLLF